MSLIDKINSVQAIALAGLERANNNVSLIQNIRITTGQILNFGSQVRAQGLNGFPLTSQKQNGKY